jgi:predicted anti-sigma-YlaC factor YlaD
MDCPKAENAMMRYIEKSITPSNARDLARHVLRCEPCRALYLTLDAAAEMLAVPPAEAPDGFTEGVMARVRTLPAYRKSLATAPTGAENGNAAVRILWGLSGIVMGFALMLALNPHWLETVTGISRLADAIRMGLTAVADFFGGAVAWLAQLDITHAIINSGLGITALVFASLIIALLYGLHRGENKNEQSVGA